MHEIGFVHNDIKDDNISIGFFNEPNKPNEVRLIDYGISNRFEGCTESVLVDFKGNIIMASCAKLNYKQSTRREDVISIGYLILHLMGCCPFQEVTNNRFMTFYQKYDRIKDMK